MLKNTRGMKSPKKRSVLTCRTLSSKTNITGATASGNCANIKVFVRVRPPNPEKELGDNNNIVVKIVDDQMLIFDPKEEEEGFFYHGVHQKNRDMMKKANKNLEFLFDKIFNYSSNNQDVFKNTTYSLISNLMDGYNCSVFAYGATGAGKTFTMIGNDTTPGITFLTMAELFERKQQLSKERDFEIGITYIEVYNEVVRDLLNPGDNLQLRDNGKYGVCVAGIKYNRIETPAELFRLLDQGNKNRSQHPTDLNAESSRSHAVFQVYIQMTTKTTGEKRSAKLSMIDLAGSERGAAATGCNGVRFTEGANINKSLLALGNCINSLADGNRHVPYRDSKLTRLLKDSLGGNCYTIMIANVSPSSLTYEDTYNTLKYASRAKTIKSTIKKNVVSVNMHTEHYVKLVEELNKEVARLKSEAKMNRDKNRRQGLEVELELKEEIEKLFEEAKALVERQCQMEMAEQLINIRRQIKGDADARLSGLCTDTPEKEDGHRRLGNTIERFGKQTDTLKEEIQLMKEKKAAVESRFQELLKENPYVQPLIKLKEHELKLIENKHESELNAKKMKMYEEEIASRGEMLTRMAKVLKPCFMQIRGHGLASSNLLADYHELVRYSQGIRCIKWEEETDSGMSTVTTEAEEEPTEKKSCSSCSSKTMLLDSTFVKTPVKNKSTDSSNKAFKPQQKGFKKAFLSSPRLRENRERRPLHDITPSRTTTMKRVNSQRMMQKKPMIASNLNNRPPFRR